jgi:RecB family exonuclease
MTNQLTLSPSKINTFERCQLQYKFRYLDNLRKPPGVAAAIGTATHTAIEGNLRSKMDTGALLPLEAVQQAARDTLENTWAGGVQLDADEPADKGEAADQAVALATLHHKEIAPTIAPIALERPFGVDACDGVKLTGHIDVQEADAITDNKTIGKTPSVIKGDHLNQVKLYAIGALANDGVLPASVRVDYLVKTKTPKAVRLSEPMTRDSAQNALNRLKLQARVIKRATETGDFLPAPADGWACSDKWCGYFAECPFGKAARTGARAEG